MIKYKRKSLKEFKNTILDEMEDRDIDVEDLGPKTESLVIAISKLLFEQQEALFPPGTLLGDKLTDLQYVAKYARKIEADGRTTFFNHDINKYEEATPGRLKALEELQKNFYNA